MDTKPETPGYVRWVTSTLEKEGYETWAVGGAIRNALLGLAPGDWDLATRAPPPVVQRLFRRTVPIGIDHGTVGVLTREGILLEVTTFRRDVETSGRHAVVEFADTLKEDLARRDFTVNAIAWHALRKEFQDPFDGRKDLEAGLIRTVGRPSDRFSEDYLRILRALRFAGKFGFRIDEGTWEALCQAAPHLGILSPERIREELMKVLSQDPRPSASLSLYAESGALEVLYPELSAIVDTPRPGTEEGIWVHSLALVDSLSPRRPTLRLAGLLNGIGIPEDDVGEGKTQDDRARDRAAALLMRGRFSNAEIREVTALLGTGLEPPLHLEEAAGVRRWLFLAGPDRFRAFVRLWAAKARVDGLRLGKDTDPVAELVWRMRRELSGKPPLRLEDLAVNGRDLIGLGMKPGPHFSDILDGLMDKVLDDPDVNTKEHLLSLVESDDSVQEASG